MQKAKPGRRSANRAAPQHVRIIGGQWKRTPLAVIHAEGLRPTPDRVRETVFNWLQHLVEGRWEQLSCLDLFAGTGSLGFEAASRGAQRVWLVEADRSVARQLEAVRAKLNAQSVTILCSQAVLTAERLAAGPEKQGFDVIFLDPPYHQDWLPKILPLCKELVSAPGWVYVECEFPLADETSPAWLSDWDVVRADRAGAVFYHLLRRKSAPEIQA